MAVATVGLLFFAAGCGSSGGEGKSDEHPASGPAYDAAMERCALSRLRNAGVDDPSSESQSYVEAYTACGYGTSYDDVTAPGQGWGPADPGYWDE
ncbi:hypothetical protein GCM10023336_56670 [Streptomyces similanensis]|uniref:Lipoprotein n=1 Tax=Streptomyces similanensis TaxID=1274988 RepID=A0ABP9L8F9_9ACTN